jgi:hypothetical protein
MGLLHDKRHFQFAEGTPDWERWPHYRLVFSPKECITVNPLR